MVTTSTGSAVPAPPPPPPPPPAPPAAGTWFNGDYNPAGANTWSSAKAFCVSGESELCPFSVSANQRERRGRLDRLGHLFIAAVCSLRRLVSECAAACSLSLHFAVFPRRRLLILSTFRSLTKLLRHCCYDRRPTVPAVAAARLLAAPRWATSGLRTRVTLHSSPETSLSYVSRGARSV